MEAPPKPPIVGVVAFFFLEAAVFFFLVANSVIVDVDSVVDSVVDGIHLCEEIISVRGKAQDCSVQRTITRNSVQRHSHCCCFDDSILLIVMLASSRVCVSSLRDPSIMVLVPKIGGAGTPEIFIPTEIFLVQLGCPRDKMGAEGTKWGTKRDNVGTRWGQCFFNTMPTLSDLFGLTTVQGTRDPTNHLAPIVTSDSAAAICSTASPSFDTGLPLMETTFIPTPNLVLSNKPPSTMPLMMSKSDLSSISRSIPTEASLEGFVRVTTIKGICSLEDGMVILWWLLVQ